MALRANRPIEGYALLSTLASEYGYRAAEPEEVAIYLDHYQELFAPLAQASAAIVEFFPNRTGVELSISRDYDSDDSIVDGILFVTVDLPDWTADTYLERINAFLDYWYVLASRDSLPARQLIFDLREHVHVA